MAVKTWAGPAEHAWDPQPDEFTTEYAGLVVDKGEHNWHDDSDFYAVVWDAEAGRPREVTYATTRGWTYNNSAAVDATPEVAAAYAEYKAQLDAERRAAWADAAARTPAKGKIATVVKGRKVPVGTTGEIIWAGAGRYGQRVGIKDAEGTVHWTAAGNVEVQLPA